MINRNNFKIILNNASGFTLIELLLVMVIIGFIGAISVGIISSTLRSENKSNIISQVRQNGDYAINQIQKTLAYTSDFEGVCDPATADCTDKQNYVTYCTNPTQVYKYIRYKNSDGKDMYYSCNDSSSDTPPNTIASGSAVMGPNSAQSLIDTNAMKVTSCNIYCQSFDTTISPTINITFTLTSNGTLAENTSQISFETSIKPRNDPSGP